MNAARTESNLTSLARQREAIAALMDPVPVWAPADPLKSPLLPTPAQANPVRFPNGSFQPAVLKPGRPPLAVEQFLAEALLRRWQTYREQLRKCQQGFSEETVHELRVASRRLIAQLAMIEAVTPGATVEKVRRLLKRRLKALGDLRDVHVQRLFIERRLERFPQLIVVWDFLDRRERRLERSVAAKVKGFKARKLERWISRVSSRLALRAASADGTRPIGAAVEQAAAQAFAEVARRRNAIDPGEPSTIHRTRIAFKKYRYMVEALSPGLTGLRKSDLRALARFQRRMGIVQDLEVMQKCIIDILQRHAGMEQLLRPFCRYLQKSRARRLRSFLKSADDVFSFWPPSRVKSNGHVASATLSAA